MISQLSVTTFFTIKLKCMMVFYSLNYAMQCFYCKQHLPYTNVYGNLGYIYFYVNSILFLARSEIEACVQVAIEFCSSEC